MPDNRIQLDAQLDDLATQLPRILSETRESDVLEAFAGIADGIRERAGPVDRPHVDRRLRSLLEVHGLVTPAPAMSSEQLDAELRALGREIAEFASSPGDRNQQAFADWFWSRADAIKADAGPTLAQLADDGISDLADSALDAGLFHRGEDPPA